VDALRDRIETATDQAATDAACAELATLIDDADPETGLAASLAVIDLVYGPPETTLGTHE
jgi:hypothetical protein